jgi:hypothetical protein
MTLALNVIKSKRWEMSETVFAIIVLSILWGLYFLLNYGGKKNE